MNQIKVLLVEPNNIWSSARPWTPWGKMHLAAYLRENKFTPYIMDNAFWKGDSNRVRHTIEKDIRPDIIGIGGMTIQHTDAMQIAKTIHGMYNEKDRPLMVAGGVHFTFCPEDAYDLFDIVVIGEGEQSLLEVCQIYEATGKKGGDDYRHVKGIHFKDTLTGLWIVNGHRDLLDLSKMPIPAFDLLPWYKDYSDHLITGEKSPMLMTDRGCPYDCEFCASPQLYKRKTRVFPVEWIMDCIVALRKVHPGRSYRIMDDTFALSNRRVEEFCEKVAGPIGKPKMSCLTHCNTVNPEIMRIMKEHGFFITALGVESGNDEILKKINKGATVEQSGRALQVARESGMFVEALYMIGNIGETEETIIDTINFAKRYNPNNYSLRGPCWNWFQFATPFPGSRMYTDAEKYGTVLSRDYNRYNHQEAIFVPHGLTPQKMNALRERAFRETQ